LSKKKGKKVW